MIKQVPGKIYLADQRGLVESPQFRRQSTFNFGAFQSEHKGPFGNLYGLNEETLGGGHEVALPVAQDSYVVVLPITGSVAYRTGGASGVVEVGAVLTLVAPAGTLLQLHNPYADELVSCFHLWLSAATPLTAPATELQTVFQELRDNELLTLVGERAPGQPSAAPLPFRLSLGRFMGRHEAVYRVAHEGSQLVAFLLAGAFELESRLLHEKDSLALWDVEEVELEALSNHAIVVLLELMP
jgi:redox-sensitive bicupin YhaK (pirin superfamily)